MGDRMYASPQKHTLVLLVVDKKRAKALWYYLVALWKEVPIRFSSLFIQQNG
jgi:hypothetical protein